MFEGNIIVSVSFSHEKKNKTENITTKGNEKCFIKL